MGWVLGVVGCAVVVVLGWHRAARQKKLQAVPVAKRAARSDYHCVEVRTGVPACEAAQRLGHTRFLPDEAPSLPVSGCTVKTCTCGYIHHDDRREEDRRNPYGQWANMPPAIAGERRSRRERRKSQERTLRPSMAR